MVTVSCVLHIFRLQDTKVLLDGINLMGLKVKLSSVGWPHHQDISLSHCVAYGPVADADLVCQ